MRLFIDDPSEDGALVQIPADREAMRERLGLTEEDLAELAADAWYEAGREHD